MLTPDFYPTPRTLIRTMLSGIDMDEVRTVLEPSAGKGDICDVLKATHGDCRRDLKLDVIELDPELQHVLTGKGYNLIHDDFLTFETQKAYDLVVANFPFSEGDRHLSKALALLERNGGALVCLVNAETIRNPYTNLRKAMLTTLDRHHADVQYIAGAFRDAERPTDVEVALVRVTLPKPVRDSLVLDDLQRADAAHSPHAAPKEIIDADPINALVQRFKMEARAGVRLIEEYEALRPYVSECPTAFDIERGEHPNAILELQVRGEDSLYCSGAAKVQNAYLAALRKKYWSLLIGNEDFTRSYTSNITDELYRRIDTLKESDFTLFNIRKLEEELKVKIRTGVEKSILDLFDKYSREHSMGQSGNIHYFSGWKSNAAHKINKKVVVPFYGFDRWDGRLNWYNAARDLADTMKVFRYLEGDETDISAWIGSVKSLAELHGTTRNLNCRYFTVSFFKKGTAHIVFTNQRLLDKFNIFAAQRRGWLPPSYGKTPYGEMPADERAVVDAFQGEAAYRAVLQDQDYYLRTDSALLLSPGESTGDAA